MENMLRDVLAAERKANEFVHEAEKYRAESLVTDPKIHGLTDKIQIFQKSENPEEKSKIPELK